MAYALFQAASEVKRLTGATGLGENYPFVMTKEKSFLGRNYMGMRRITFLIGPDGRIRKIWRKVKIPQHATEVLAAAVEIMGQGG